MKNIILILMTFLITTCITITSSCKKDKEAELPVLTTIEANSILITSAISGGNITSDGGDEITSRGVCWSTSQNPTLNDSFSNDGTGTGNFSRNLTGLSANTTYYVRAYATNKAGTAYGNEINLKTYTTTVTDADGNTYYAVTIGTQIWMAENLKTKKYRDGTPIPNVTDDNTWNNLSTGAYCYYNNDVNNYSTYGCLYNWYAVNDSRCLAPIGWHVPTNTDWATLISYLGGDEFASGKLKEAGFTHWNAPNTGATNDTKFTALPGGTREYASTFISINICGSWWSSISDGAGGAYGRTLINDANYVIVAHDASSVGLSVRCVKD